MTLVEDLIEIVNSGNAWAFIGSGVSCGSNLPSWPELVAKVHDLLSSKNAMSGSNATEYSNALNVCDLPRAFLALQQEYGRPMVDQAIGGIILGVTNPSELHRELAQWPFAGYVTTNYDHLQEIALEQVGGWIPVGNTPAENAKISGSVTNVVWHPHGGVSLGSKNSRLVTSTEDYEEFYPAGSPTSAALGALIRMRRLVFIGFGFKDPDLMKLLEQVARVSSPGMPAYGFLSNTSAADRAAYRKKYNTVVIPYEAKGRDHSDLNRLLEGYRYFVVTRNIRFGSSAGITPDYDEKVTNLLTHNRLVRSRLLPSDNVGRVVARAALLARLRSSENCPIDQLVAALPQNEKSSDHIVDALNELIRNNLVRKSNSIVNLTKEGRELATSGRADSELARDLFVSSIQARLRKANDTLKPDALGRITDVVAGYLEDACKKRGLGVAQQIDSTDSASSQARIIALLQGIHKSLENLTDREEGFLAVRIVRSILGGPTSHERSYLGFLTQAYFCIHLLNYDQTALKIQRDESKKIASLLLIPAFSYHY